MKTSLMLTTFLFTSSVFAGIIREKFPTVPVTDAMGTRQISVKQFCISDDHLTLKGRIRYCEKAVRSARGYKKCTSRSTSRLVEIENFFSYTVRGPRDRVVEYSYSIDPILEIKVIDFDPRGSEEVIDTYEYVIPTCDF